MADIWEGCYDLSWKEVIVPAAFAHPAKMARGLLRRILDHAFEQGWVQTGSIVVDCFGGIGSTAIEGAYRGLQVITCELEPKFVALANENMTLHARHWTTLGCPQPVILQGDSRRLTELVREAGCVVGSPPFVETGTGADKEAHNRQVITSGTPTHRKGALIGKTDYADSTPGQLGAMKAGSVSAVVGSPPFSTGDTASAQSIEKRTDKSAMWIKKNLTGSACTRGYGESPGQLAALPTGSVAAVLSSPPYEGSINTNENGSGIDYSKAVRGGKGRTAGRESIATGYGCEDGQLGTEIGDTFWSAARLIVEQCHQLLPPGGHACWVVKDFVRNKQRVDFCGDWRRLCEAVGFRLVCEHRAMLTRSWEEATLFEGTVRKEKSRKSFFRRLCEAKGSPRIDYETVQCFVR